MIKTKLINKIEKKTACIGIIGLGYVGLPLLLRFAKVGFNVIGFDIDKYKIDQIKAGKSYIKHIDESLIVESQKNIDVTADFERIKEVDALILCVPTPLNKYREPDLSFVVDTISACSPFLQPGQVISLESTTYPGTTEEIIKPKIEEKGFSIGKELFIVYSPEREDPGNTKYQKKSVPKVCSGITKDCLDVGMSLYGSIIETIVPVSSTKTAEMTKLLENIHRAVNIGLVNEMKIVADHMNIDINEVIDAASTKPYGFVPYYPGPGIGGHCIPIDPFYLTWKAREYGLHTRFIELAGEINNHMPKWVVHKVSYALNERNLPLKNSKILILGLSYKPDVDDIRESPSIRLITLLKEKGAIVDYSDPYVASFPKTRDYDYDMNSVNLDPNVIQNYDCILVSTAHSKCDYDMIKDNARLIVDTRGVYKGNHPNVIKA